MTTVDHADIRGLGTTLLASVGCLPHSRDESTCWPLNAAEGYTKPGLRLFRYTLVICYLIALRCVPLRSHGDLPGNGPHEADQFPGNGDDDLVHVFPAGEQLAIPLTEPHLGLPTDILDDFRLFFES